MQAPEPSPGQSVTELFRISPLLEVILLYSLLCRRKPRSRELLTLQNAVLWQGHNVCEFTFRMNALYIGKTAGDLIFSSAPEL